MSFVEIFVMALALSVDACAVSLAASTSGHVNNTRAKFRLSFHFGLFQGLMPVIGWFLGSTLAPIIADFDHWIAFLLLVGIALKMLWAAYHPEAEQQNSDPTRGLTMVMLAVATSIDALAVGLSLAMVGTSIWYPSAVIAVVTGLACLVAIRIGCCVGAWLDKQAQVAGGIALILIAVRIVAFG